jgi:membrane-bound serine protease (ClpP class)
MASNIAAMAPATNIGSAHPVAAGGQDIPGVEGDKITNDAAAYIRTVATKRGHNADWAEQAVRNSINITEQQAVDQKVANLTATDLRDLLNKINGQQVTVSTGTVTLETAGAAVIDLKMTFLERLLQTLVDPTIDY